MKEEKWNKVFDVLADLKRECIDSVEAIDLIDTIYKETPMYAVTNYIRVLSIHDDEQEADKEAEKLKCDICNHNEIKVYEVRK